MAAKPRGKIPNYLREEISLAVSPCDWLEKARQLKKSAKVFAPSSSHSLFFLPCKKQSRTYVLR